MAIRKPVGQGASSKKYDILTALSVHGLSADKHVQRQVLRIIALITSRYNWRGDELSMGHKEIARLWAVDPRTVKREMAKLRDKNWIVVKRQGARGRVSTYGINLDLILKDTQEQWPNVGPDFVERAGGLLPAPASPKIVKVDFGKPQPKPIDIRKGSWSDVCASLRAIDPVRFENWLARLDFKMIDDAVLVLTAPSSFIAQYVQTHLSDFILKQASGAYPGVKSLRVET
ncbi:hypothetical protein GCM10008927_29120 [Amylibacter ulvae]|uniref:DnaA N-terminal domain-containing protein n=1 Tax=Paramylibacter ulvae TaxID=1651968 RepID=A0ABQ3D941_9RHOB|nr:DnaA N-terminal domain-containing protein [Amylibacter ulvae]GHA61846.1 hypothetical protein GCM10008927_29120 [Amylibacter ulvae]